MNPIGPKTINKSSSIYDDKYCNQSNKNWNITYHILIATDTLLKDTWQQKKIWFPTTEPAGYCWLDANICGSVFER